jgi:5-methylcytosine-specific restriction enzyme subunit McrC
VPRVIELQEEQPLSIPKEQFTDDLAIRIHREHGSRIEIQFPNPFNNHSYVLRSKGCVGHIPVSSDLVIRIRPKVPVANLFRMLEYAYNLSSFRFLEGESHVDKIEDIFDRLASILAGMVLNRARKGLYRSYVSVEDSLSFVRGRINLTQSLINQTRGVPLLTCTYEEHTADLDENRILAWTLYRLPFMDIQRDVVRRRVSQAFRVLAGTVEVSPKYPRDCVGRFYHRLNSDYRPMHGLCRFFLENAGPELDSGTFNFLPFIMDMPTLFESFVSHWLKAQVPIDLQIRTQYVATLDSLGKLHFRIDNVLMHRKTHQVLAVLDTKYKRSKDPDEADIQQIVAYAVRMGVKEGWLIYPSTTTCETELNVGNVVVRTKCFDLSGDLDSEGLKFLNFLLSSCCSEAHPL